MKIIKLKSLKFGVDGVRSNYEKPIRVGKVRFNDGTFLCDPDFGIMFGVFAKEIEPGCYQSTKITTHFMYEEGVEDDE